MLQAWSDGGRGALDRLTAFVHDELRRPARRYMSRERPGHSLQTTAEVLKVSPVTVMRDWSTAEAWLYRELTGGTGDESRSMETGR
jgi:hypothetical protein